MSKDYIISGVFGEIAKAVEKNLPKILFSAGVAASVAGVVSAVKATRKLDDILVDGKESLQEVEEREITEEYTSKDKDRDKFFVRAKTARNIAWLYSGTVALEAVSLACFGKSYGILSDRNMKLSAVTLMAERMLKERDEAVRERFGDDVARDIRNNLKEIEVEKEVVDKNGRKKTVKTKEKVSFYDGRANFARYFDSSSLFYERGPIIQENGLKKKVEEYNKSFILSVQTRANNELYRRYFYGSAGRVTMNEVYEWLGFETTKEGALAGWTFDPTDPKCMSKEHIDFGIFDSKKNIDFVNGNDPEAVCFLDFNIDTLNVFGEC